MAVPGGQEAELGQIIRKFLEDSTRKDGWVTSYIVDPSLSGSAVGMTDEGIPTISPEGLVALVKAPKDAESAEQKIF